MSDPGPAPDQVEFDGIVLTGGASRRMGTDKALLEVRGVALARRAHDALHVAGARQVIAVGGDGPALRGLGLTVVADRHPGAGPLGGIVTGFAATTAPIVVVVACDQPAVDPTLVRRLVELVGTSSADAAVPVVDGVRQVLCAALGRQAAGPLEEAFDQGERSIRRVLLGLEVVELPEVDPAAVIDLDRPDDVRRYALGPPPDDPDPR